MEELITTLMNNLVLPAIVAISAVVISMANKFIKNLTKNLNIKTDLLLLEHQLNIRNKFTAAIEESVKTAVGANMSSAEDMKQNGGVLFPEEQEFLINKAKETVNTSIRSLLGEDSELLNAIGGEEALNVMIDALIEKYVYEYKKK